MRVLAGLLLVWVYCGWGQTGARDDNRRKTADCTSGERPVNANVPVPRKVYTTAYPSLAHLTGVEGEVHLAAQVSPLGSVQNVRVVSGPGLLGVAAKTMLAQWVYFSCSAQAGSCEAEVTFRFVLDAGACDGAGCADDFQLDLPSTITIRSKRRKPMAN
jgi:hypothetical protein